MTEAATVALVVNAERRWQAKARLQRTAAVAAARGAAPVPVAAPAPEPAPTPRCPRHGDCALLRVERHRDFTLERRRALFTCGFDAWSPAAGAWAPRPVEATEAVCTACGAAFERRATRSRKCPGCRRCVPCAGRGDYHAVADCPKRAAAVA